MIWSPRRRAPVPVETHSKVTIMDAAGTVLRVIDPPAASPECAFHGLPACRRCLLTAPITQKYRRRKNP